MARTLKKLFGILTLLMGASIVVWFIYNQFAPTPDFERSYTSFVQLAVPLAMIWVGWRWLTATPAEQARRYPHSVVAKIPVPIEALERRSKYAESLQDSLAERELGRVSDRGRKLTEDGKVAWVELAIELENLQGALEFTRQRLRELGAPPGSVLEYRTDGRDIVLPIRDMTMTADKIGNP